MAFYNMGGSTETERNPYTEAMVQHIFDMQKERLRQSGERASLNAREKADQATTNKSNFTRTWQALSNKDEGERTIFLTSEQGKEYLKAAKKYIPEVFDDAGKPVFFPAEKRTTAEEIAYTRQVEEVKAKIDAGKPLSVGDAAALLKVAQYGKEESTDQAELVKYTQLEAYAQEILLQAKNNGTATPTNPLVEELSGDAEDAPQSNGTRKPRFRLIKE